MLQQDTHNDQLVDQEREVVELKQQDRLRADIARFKEVLLRHENGIKQAQADRAAVAALLQDQSTELARINGELALRDDECAALRTDNTKAESGLQSVHASHSTADFEKHKQIALHARQQQSYAETLDRERIAQAEVRQVEQQLKDLRTEVEKQRKETDETRILTQAALEANTVKRLETAKQAEQNSLLAADNEGTVEKIKGLEIKLARVMGEEDKAILLYEAKDTQAKNANIALAHCQETTIEFHRQMSILRTENAALQELIEKYQDSAQRTHKLRHEEAGRKRDFMQESLKLQQEARTLELDTKAVQQQLRTAHEVHEGLLGEHENLSRELEALKAHTEVLQTQNTTAR